MVIKSRKSEVDKDDKKDEVDKKAAPKDWRKPLVPAHVRNVQACWYVCTIILYDMSMRVSASITETMDTTY